MLWKILEKVFFTKKFTQCKISCFLKISVFETPDNKNIGIFFSNYWLLFLDKTTSSSDSSQILILQFPIPRASLPLLASLSTFKLSNRILSSTQSFSCSSLISVFCPTPFYHTPPQVLDITNLMPAQSNQVYYQAIWIS